MFVGMRCLGWSIGSLEAISAARGAAVGVFNIIDAVSKKKKENSCLLCVCRLYLIFIRCDLSADVTCQPCVSITGVRD